jgi:hypothetical protein
MTLVKFSFVAEVGQKFQKMKHKKNGKNSDSKKFSLSRFYIAELEP